MPDNTLPLGLERLVGARAVAGEEPDLLGGEGGLWAEAGQGWCPRSHGES